MPYATNDKSESQPAPNRKKEKSVQSEGSAGSIDFPEKEIDALRRSPIWH
ncbi:hypothetical protein [Rossellomorea vietnamensis]|nr:hypothetical protein [Rossellomorea vietnamensis]